MKVGNRIAAALVFIATAGAGVAHFSAPRAWACSYGESPDILCSNEQQFINDLSAKGITPTQSPHILAGLGWKVCGDLYSGRTAYVEANRVYAYNTGLGGDGAQALVAAAIADLCPDATGPHYIPPGSQPIFNLP